MTFLNGVLFFLWTEEPLTNQVLWWVLILFYAKTFGFCFDVRYLYLSLTKFKFTSGSLILGVKHFLTYIHDHSYRKSLIKDKNVLITPRYVNLSMI